MPLKVLHIVRTPLTVRAFFKPLLAEHQRRGHHVELAYAPDPAIDDDFGVPVHAFPMRRSLSPAALVQSLAGLKRIIQAGSYDIMVPHMVLAGAVGRWAYVQAGRPGKLLYVSHGLPCYPHSIAWKRWAALAMERGLSRCQTGMIVLNRHDYDLANRFAAGRVHLLQTIGIDVEGITVRARQTDVTAYRQTLGLPPERPLVCYVGRLTEAKGADQFLRIAKQVLDRGVDVSFVMAGSGPLDHELQSYIHQHHLQDRVTLLGWISETIECFAASDVFCFPTLYEGAPIVVQEAMAAGTLVLTSDVPGPADLVEHEQTGVIAPAGDIHRFADLLVDLLREPERRTQITRQARIKARDYDAATWAPRWVDVIEETARVR